MDEALAAMVQRKAENVGSEAASAAVDSTDLAAEGLSLRTQMQRAVEEERCGRVRLCARTCAYLLHLRIAHCLCMFGFVCWCARGF